MAAVTRRQYKGAAASTTTTNALTSGDTSVTLAATTGWPSTAAVPFYVVIDPGTSSEEKCSATISGSTLTLTRGQDDTTAVAHSSGATIYPVFSADDADEANALASVMTTRGDIIKMGTGPTVARLAIGTTGYALISDGTDPSWGQIDTAGITNLAVTGTKLANDTVSTKTASYTLVAADRNTRVVMNSASATTITVNTSLFAAGDTLTILNIGAGVCTITAGTATVSTTGTLALVQNAGGTLYFTSAGVSVFQASGVTATASGLTLISSTTVGTVVASVTVSNAFSATYDNYKVTYTGGIAAAGVDLGITLGATSTDYYFVLGYIPYSSATFAAISVNNGAGWLYAGGANTALTSLNCDILRPFATDETLIVGNGANASNGQFFGGYLNNTTSYTAFTIAPSNWTLTGGTIRVYGYQNS